MHLSDREMENDLRNTFLKRVSMSIIACFVHRGRDYDFCLLQLLYSSDEATNNCFHLRRLFILPVCVSSQRRPHHVETIPLSLFGAFLKLPPPLKLSQRQRSLPSTYMVNVRFTSVHPVRVSLLRLVELES